MVRDYILIEQGIALVEMKVRTPYYRKPLKLDWKFRSSNLLVYAHYGKHAYTVFMRNHFIRKLHVNSQKT